MRSSLPLPIALLVSAAALQSGVQIEYIAHACFRIEAASGHSIGDIQALGLAGRHAQPYGKEFEQRNTVWLIEVDGIRILHVGDNGPLSESILSKVGRVDILMLPVDDLDHILKAGEVAEMRRRLQPRVVVPMHYRLEKLSKLPASLGPIDEWLTRQQNVRRLESSTVQLARDSFRAHPKVYVFEPSSRVMPWSEELHRAWALRDEARASNGAAKVAKLTSAHSLAPTVLPFSVELAEALWATDPSAQARQLLESTLAGAGQTDWEYRNRGRILLARIYRHDGNSDAAAQQYRLLLKEAYRTAWLEEASNFLSAEGPESGN